MASVFYSAMVSSCVRLLDYVAAFASFRDDLRPGGAHHACD